MAIWGKKKKPDGDEGVGDQNGDSEKTPAFTPQPEKARKWFDPAKSMADRFSFESALHYYANGVKFDPETMSAHEAMYAVAVKYMNDGGKPATGKEIKNIAADGHVVAKFAAAELAWMTDLQNATLALKMLEAAGNANLQEVGHFFARRVFNLLVNQKKITKNALLSAKDMFAAVGAWDEAIACGERALQLDPNDSNLATELKDFSAQRAMDQGGYEAAAGKEGAFREFIRDADTQRELQESEAIAGGASIDERNFARAKAAYQDDPTVPDNVNLYAQLLKKQDTPEAVQKAYEIYVKGFQDTGEYRFRRLAGDIKIEQGEKHLKKLASELSNNGQDQALRTKHDESQRELLAYKAAEYSERVSKYPTDRRMKFDLGIVEYDRGNYQDAMAQFQAAKDEPKLSVRAGHMLGKCFAGEGWHNEAIEEYDEALSKIDPTTRDHELPIRYDLMVSLIEHGRAEHDVGLVKRAREICSSIARKNITFRDIRERRRQIDEVLKAMSSGGSMTSNE